MNVAARMSAAAKRKSGLRSGQAADAGLARPFAPSRGSRIKTCTHTLAGLGSACLPGLAVCGSIAALAIFLSATPWIKAHGISALVIAMVVGAAVGNLFHSAAGARCMPGIALCKQKALRLGIILYGVHLTFADIADVGFSGVLVDALVLVSTFFLALMLGTRVLRMDAVTVVLIGAGSAICGAAAVLATEPVVRARPEQVTVAIATVVLFGTLATFLYPFLFHLNQEWQLLPVSYPGFGLYVGSTIHEVAQVVAAAQLINMDVAHTAVIAKMVRVMMLPLFLVALSLYLMQAARRSRRQDEDDEDDTPPRKLAMPWFALGFLLVVMLNSGFTLPQQVHAHLVDLDTVLLTMAMAGLGLTTHVSAFRQAGFKPVVLAACLFLWLVAGGAWINGLAAL